MKLLRYIALVIFHAFLAIRQQHKIARDYMIRRNAERNLPQESVLRNVENFIRYPHWRNDRYRVFRGEGPKSLRPFFTTTIFFCTVPTNIYLRISIYITNSSTLNPLVLVRDLPKQTALCPLCPHSCNARFCLIREIAEK